MIRLSKSVISEEEKHAVAQVLGHEYLGMGQDVQEFEALLSGFFQRPVVCVSTGTAALHLALQSCGVGVGDEVLVPSLTYVASFQAISATGAIPVPCEILSDTLTMDPVDAEQRITKKTKAIMPVHYAGGCGELNEIYGLAEQYGLRVVEDAAHAFGSVYEGRVVGSFGDVSCFSFDGIKNITSGEGGAIVSNDAELVQKVRDARLLGVAKDTEKRFSGSRSWEFDVTEQGWRYHMSNLMAAIGKTQFQKKEIFSEKRQYLAKLYDRLFQELSGIQILPLDYRLIVPHIYVVRIKNGKREHIRALLQEKKIETGIHYFPNHRLSYFQNLLKKKNSPIPDLPLTDSVYSEILTLPLHPELSDADVHFVVDTLKQAFR